MTLLDSAHIKEMKRFTGIAVDDIIWPRICYRSNHESKVDFYDCSRSAYENLTKFFEPYVDKYTDL